MYTIFIVKPTYRSKQWINSKYINCKQKVFFLQEGCSCLGQRWTRCEAWRHPEAHRVGADQGGQGGVRPSAAAAAGPREDWPQRCPPGPGSARGGEGAAGRPLLLQNDLYNCRMTSTTAEWPLPLQKDLYHCRMASITAEWPLSLQTDLYHCSIDDWRRVTHNCNFTKLYCFICKIIFQRRNGGRWTQEQKVVLFHSCLFKVCLC